MAKNVFGDEIQDAPVNAFGDPIESSVAVLPEPIREPLSPEDAFERAGKVWDAAIENDVPLVVADQWLYDAGIASSDPDDFAEPVPDNRTGFSENFKREWTFEKGITKLPIVGGILGLKANIEVIQASNRLLDAEFNYDSLNSKSIISAQKSGIPGALAMADFHRRSLDGDRAMIAQAYKDFEFESRPKTLGGKVAAITSQMPTWMVEFAATGGLARVGDKVAQKAGEKLLRKYATSFAGKAAIQTGKLVKGAVIRASTGLLPRVGEKATARQALIDIGLSGEENWATSLAKAWGDVAIESFSEETGKVFSLSVLRKLPFGGKFIGSLQDEWIKLTGGTAENFGTRLLTKGGYSTIIGELGEERIGTLLREATGVSDRRGNPFERIWAGMKEDFEPENLGAELISFLALAGAKRGMTMGVSLTPGVSVPSEAEQVDQAVGVGPIRFDTLADAQGYADKATRVADREGVDVTITVEPADNTVTIEEVPEEAAAKPSIAEQRRSLVVRKLRAGEEVAPDVREEFADLVAEIERVTTEEGAEDTQPPVGKKISQADFEAAKQRFTQQTPEEKQLPLAQEPPVQPEPLPAEDVGKVVRGKEIFTSAPQAWRKEDTLVDWGQKGIRTTGNRALKIDGKTRKTFIWTQDLTELPTRLPRSTIKAFKDRTDEIWKLQRRGKGEDVWLVPKVLKQQLEQELGEDAFVRRAKPVRSPKQKLNDLMNAMRIKDVNPAVRGEVILDTSAELGIIEENLSDTTKAFVKEFRDEQSRQGVAEPIPEGVGEAVLSEEELERIAIQEEELAGDIGDFLDGIEGDLAEAAEVAKEEPTRIISRESFEAARKRLTDPTKLRVGLDPQALKDAVIVGGFLFESGIRNFATWSKRMVSELGERIKPHLQSIWDGISKAQPKAEKPKKKPAKKKVKKPEFPKNQSVDKAEQAILGEDPIEQILGALKKAVAVAPKTEAEKKAELSRRVGAAAGALRSNVKRGTPTEQAIFKSTGLLKGPLTEYEQVYESIEDQISPEAKEAAYAKIYSHPGLSFFEILNTATSFRKLLEGTALTPRDVRNIENVFGKTFSEITDIRQQVSGLWEKLIALWKAGLLTGLKTSGLNILANASHAMTETASDIPAFLVDKVASLFTGKRSLAFTTRGYKTGVIQGLENGWKYLRTGYSERDIGKKLDYNEVFFGDSKFAKALQGYEEFIFHLLGAEDQPFYYGAKAKSIFSQAIAQGKNKKLKGKELDDFVEALIKNPTDEMLRFAVHDAEVAVFQNRTGLGDAARLFQKINIAGVPVGQIIAPFGRTPAAVATQIINYTPIGVIGEVAAQIRNKEFNQRQFSQAAGRAVIGTGALFIGGMLLKAGLMTLDRPRDERERKLWELEGRKANSIKIGGKWRTVQTLGPAGNVLLIGGHFQHQLAQEGSPTKAIAKAMAGSAKSFSEQTFVRGVNQAVSALVDPELSAEFWFTSMAGSLVPTIVADIARANDEIQRRTVGPTQRIQSRIPVLRESLPPRIDVFGQDLPRYGGNVLETMADPTRPSKIRNDVVVDELRRLADNDIKVAPTLLGDRAGFDVLTVEENTQLWRRSGELTYKILLAWIDSDGYKNISNDFAKGKTIESLVRKTKAAAKAEIVGIKLRQGVSIVKLAESGLLSIDGMDALQFFTK